MRLLSALLFLAITFGSWADIQYTPQILMSKDSPADSSATDTKSDRLTFYDTSSVFTESWKENITFAYDVDNYNRKTKIIFVDSLSGYAFPIEKETTSGFGRRHGSYHKGIDIPIVTGEKIVAAFDGKVRYATYNGGGFGNLVIIRHKNGLETYYAHLSRIKVKLNQVVKAGDVIGLGGSTGRSYSPHLHFEMRYHDVAFNPMNVFDTESYCLKSEQLTVGELMQNGPSKTRPYVPVPAGEGTIYAIQSGDTLSKIAARNGTTVEKLCAINGLDRDDILQIGQKIRVN